MVPKQDEWWRRLCWQPRVVLTCWSIQRRWVDVFVELYIQTLGCIRFKAAYRTRHSLAGRGNLLSLSFTPHVAQVRLPQKGWPGWCPSKRHPIWINNVEDIFQGRFLKMKNTLVFWRLLLITKPLPHFAICDLFPNAGSHLEAMSAYLACSYQRAAVLSVEQSIHCPQILDIKVL